ncbi:hypothetical protein AB4403_17665 [Vibrio breoganii]
MKKYLIITPFFRDDPSCSRPAFIEQCLKEEGSEVLVITSDFCHHSKNKVKIEREEVLQVQTIRYQSNKSIKRFLSHFILSISLFVEAAKYRNSYDVIYITAPFALTILFLKIFCKHKIVVDIVDFWPVSLPFKRKGFPFSIWKFINKIAINQCDVCISTSKTFLSYFDSEEKRHHVLLGNKKVTDRKNKSAVFDKNELDLLYLGNVGRLYDFSTLIMAIKKSGLSVKLHIVGDGDYLPGLIEMLKVNRIKFQHYGSIYDSNKLKVIADKCDFGFNGYRNTNASYSYKASSYFRFGLPIINSMQGDLENYVDEFGIGYNYTSEDSQQLALILNKAFHCRIENSKVFGFFDNYLDFEVVKHKVLKIFKGI